MIRLLIAAAVPALSASPASAALSFVEDFTSLEQADLSNSSSSSAGLWNVVDGVAQAGAASQGISPSRRIDFGDGSDGDLSSSTGYVFDTSHGPFNFKSVSITGGTITVIGTSPLIIRSLGAVRITPTIDVSGGRGADGSNTNPASDIAGALGGTAVTSLADGGAGGTAKAGTIADRRSANGKDPTGAAWTYLGPHEGNDSGDPQNVPAMDGNSGFPGPNADFEGAGGFVAGDGGAGGGAYIDAGATARASGAGGGAGGGVVRISAVGTVELGTVLAVGGDGGTPKESPAQANIWECGGAGGGGSGGMIWIQSLKTISNPVLATSVLGGSFGSNGACIAPTVQVGSVGLRRGDQAGGGAAWSDTNTCPSAGGTEQGCDTSLAAASQSYVVQSKAYDLKAYNAYFTSEPAITQALNGGSIQVLYSGSKDGVTYSTTTPTLSDLSYQGYRYLKLRIVIDTAAAPGPSPTLDRIAFTYDDAGPESLPISLSFGCGSLRAARDGDAARAERDSFALYFVALLMLWGMTRLCSTGSRHSR